MGTLETHVLVIGGGPVGLFSVFMCGMMRARCILLDGLPFLGGQCQALYPEKPIYDIPACPSITGQELIDRLVTQITPFSPTILLNERAQDLSIGDGFRVTTDKGQIVSAKAVLICAGAGSFVHKRPPLDNIETFEGTSVHYHIPQKAAFAGKRIVIAGGGDSAVDWAIELSDIAADITMVHRRQQFRAQESSLERLNTLIEAGRIRLLIPFQLEALQGDGGILSHVIVKDFAQRVEHIPADVLLPFFGMTHELGSLAEWGLTLDKNRLVIDPTTGETSIPGIYALGDIATYPHKLKLIATGFAEAAQAAHHLRRYVWPDKIHGFTHSTTLGIQQPLHT